MKQLKANHKYQLNQIRVKTKLLYMPNLLMPEFLKENKIKIIIMNLIYY